MSVISAHARTACTRPSLPRGRPGNEAKYPSYFPLDIDSMDDRLEGKEFKVCVPVLIRTVDNATRSPLHTVFSTETTGLSLPTTVIGLLDHKEWPAQVSLKTVTGGGI